MADSLQTMLDFRELTTSYRSAPTMQGTPMIDKFWSDVTPTVSDEVQVYVVGRSNTPNPANTRGSMPKRQVGPGLSKKAFSLFHSFNELALDNNALRFLRSNDPAIQSIGREVVAAAISDFGARQTLLREVILGQIFTFGVVNLDADGNPVLPSVHATTGAITNNPSAAIVADFQVANSHRGNCGSLTGGAWDTTTTDIFAELQAIRDAAIKAGCEAPTTVIINPLRMSKITNNEKFKAWATQNNVSTAEVLATGKIRNFFGWNIETMEGYWTDAAGNQHPVIPVRQALIVPPGGGWKRCKEGTQDVPTTLEIQSSIEAAMQSLTPVVGRFAFAQVKVSPLLQLSLYAGDNFGLGLPNPNAVWMPTVFSA